MRLWKAIVLVNLALALGTGLSWVRWTREVRDLRQALARVQAEPSRSAGERSWTVRGIVRVVLPRGEGLFLTHEAIPGLMQAMTMGFEVDDPTLVRGLGPGDLVRFTLRERGERVSIVAVEKLLR